MTFAYVMFASSLAVTSLVPRVLASCLTNPNFSESSMPTDKILAALADPSTTYWLRDAIKSALPRDPVDALRDAETLVDLLKDRLDSTAAAVR